jgi:hypothetical protein
MKLQFSRQILEKSSDIKFYENPPRGNRVFHADGRTDMTKLILTSRNFANAPKISTFCPHSVFMRFGWISEQTAIISLYGINWFVIITETECVYCAIRTGSLTTVHVICLKSFISYCTKFLCSIGQSVTGQPSASTTTYFCVVIQRLRQKYVSLQCYGQNMQQLMHSSVLSGSELSQTVQAVEYRTVSAFIVRILLKYAQIRLAAFFEVVSNYLHILSLRDRKLFWKVSKSTCHNQSNIYTTLALMRYRTVAALILYSTIIILMLYCTIVAVILCCTIVVLILCCTIVVLILCCTIVALILYCTTVVLIVYCTTVVIILYSTSPSLNGSATCVIVTNTTVCNIVMLLEWGLQYRAG